MFTNSPWDLSDALLLSQAQVDWYNRLDPGQFLIPILGAGPPPFTFNTTVASRGVLSAVYASNADQSILLIDGVRRGDTGRDIAYSYLGAPNLNPGLGENVALARITINTVAGLGVIAPPLNHKVCVSGYSGGAAVALFIAATLQARRPDLDVSYCQFNPPRPALRQWRLGAAPVKGFRWHSNDDPIAHLPIWSSENPGATNVLPAAVLANTDRYVQFGKGLSVSADSLTVKLQPEQSPTFPMLDYGTIIQWAAGTDDDLVQAHSIVGLNQRLQALSRSVNALVPLHWLPDSRIPYADDDPAVPNELPPGQGAGSNGNAGYVGPHSTEQLLTDLGVPQTSNASIASLVPPKRFYAQKIAKKWYVMYLGQIMYGPVSKPQAKRDASHLQGVVNHAFASTVENGAELGAAVKNESDGTL